MNFYKVLVSSQRYHGKDALTYSHSELLPVGAVVVAPLQNQSVLGIVTGKVTKPSFDVKPILKTATTEPLPKAALDLLDWMKLYYPAPLGSITSQFLPNSLLTDAKSTTIPTKQSSHSQESLPKLTDEQKSAVSTVLGTNKPSSWLLHGETGTGKTRVYIEIAKQMLSKGRSVLILTPEIGLVPQIARDFENALPARIIIFHSNLGTADKRRAWQDIINADEPLVVAGPRSALFSPIKNLGLIVVDEAHEPAYKQEQSPYYYAPRVASKLAEIHRATLIFGTATPNVTDYYLAEQKNISILRLQTQPVKTSTFKPVIRVVDARDRSLFGKHPHLSQTMLEEVGRTLSNNEQSLIFLNRRGSARVVLCQNCGWQARCPVCDLPLTYHQDSHTLRCHTCGHKEPGLSACPVCGSTEIIFKSAGTKAIESSLASLFPKAKIQRFDTDNLTSERLEKHYHDIVGGKVDILVGTQMLGKGLDLPKLAFVGVVSADSSLAFPDFTAEERTYQLLSQIIGRIGRGHRPGTAVVQTFQPNSPVIAAALNNKGWQEFYKQQLVERKKYGFPPFFHLLKLSVSRKNQQNTYKSARDLKEALANSGLRVQILGPSPAFYEKTKSNYHWQLVIKAKNRSELTKVIELLPSGWSYDIDPINLL